MEKAVIFDMDGVIFDSEKAVYEGWKDLAEKYGFSDLDTVYRRAIGVNAKAAERVFLDFYGEDFPYDKYKDEQSENYHKKYDGGRLPKKPYVEELLQFLKAEGYKTAIASSTRTALVKKQVEEANLSLYFDAIIGGDLIEKSKPEPDIFLKAAELIQASPKDCYVIEDSYNGIRAAYAAKMTGIMVPDMLPPTEEMEEKAKYILKDLLEVKKLLDK